jgi:Metallo-peptidase family M12
MKQTTRQCHGARPMLMGAAIFLSTLLTTAQAAAQEHTWVIARPAPGTGPAEMERARAAMGVQQADRVVITPSGLEIWRVAKGRTGKGYYPTEEIPGGDPHEILVPVSEERLPAPAKANLEKVRARGYAKRVGVVRIPSPLVTSLMLRYSDTVAWRLFDRVRINATRQAKFSRVQNVRRFSWVGGLDAKGRECDAALFANGFASLTFGNEHLYGRFEHGGNIYQLVPLGEGYHATIEVDPAKLPDQPDLAHIEDEGGDMLDLADVEDEGGGEPPPNITDEGGDIFDPKGTGAPKPPYNTCKIDAPKCNTGTKAVRATIRVGVGFTREAMADLPAIGPATPAGALASAHHFADYLVNVTNAAFLRSGVISRVALAGIHIFDKLESAPYNDAQALLLALRTYPPDAAIRPVHQWRDHKGADVVMLLTHVANYPIIGPVAGLSPPPGTLGNANHAYSIVVTKSADAQLSFQHELGHLLGGGHNWQVNTPASFTYAHGFRRQCDWRTIMSYEDPLNCTSGTPRYALFSSCNVLVNGNAIAGSSLENNTRVVNEQAEAISKYRP